MSISLIIIGVISLLVVGGAIYLLLTKDEELNDGKKSLILLTIGVVIFLSFLVTTFKHRNLGIRNNSEDGVLDIKKVFFRGNCDFNHQNRYVESFEIAKEDINQIYKRNHMSLYDQTERGQELDTFKEHYQEMLLFLSKKDEGVSRFMTEVAQLNCKQRKTAVVYVKLEREVKKQDEFLKKVGVYSFEQLHKNYCHFSKVDITVNAFNEIEYVPHLSSKRVAPYLIIDNFEYLLGTLAEPSHYSSFNSENLQGNEYVYQDEAKHIKYYGRKRLFEKILKELVFNCRINIILNTEKQAAIEELYDLWQDSQLYRDMRVQKGGNVPFPFEYHRWEGLKQYDLFKIISSNFPANNNQLSKLLEINQQSSYTFRDLYMLVEELKRKTSNEKIELKKELNQVDLKVSVAKYYGLLQAYTTIKTASSKKISYLKDLVHYDELTRLEQLGLVDTKQGNVFMR